jgi:hypothetical protein
LAAQMPYDQRKNDRTDDDQNPAESGRKVV